MRTGATAFLATGLFLRSGFLFGADFLGAGLLADGLVLVAFRAPAGFAALAWDFGAARAEEGRGTPSVSGGMICERAWGIATGLHRNSLLTATRPQLRQI